MEKEQRIVDLVKVGKKRIANDVGREVRIIKQIKDDPI